MFKIGQNMEVMQALGDAYKSGDHEQIATAWNMFCEDVAQTLQKEHEKFLNDYDANVLAQRGCRQLTSEESKFYQKWIESAKSSNPKQAFTDLLTEGGMPETIIEDVYKDIVGEHPLLSKIKFQDVKYLTTWLLNTHDGTQKAIWGEITSEIVKAITSGFKTMQMNQNKLSAYVVLAQDMLTLGPVWLDNYVRTILKEAIYLGLEFGIAKGSGVKGEPIGLNKNVAKGVSVDTEKGYPVKDSIEVFNFLPESYGVLVGELMTSESGAARVVKEVGLLCNPKDSVTKIMPATTVLTGIGTYAKDVFPFPTFTIPSVAMDEGEAILFDPEGYFLGIGHQKDATIEYSDDAKFLEDQRVYKGKFFANGKPIDNKVALVLDISALEPLYITVVNKEDTPTG